MPDPTIPAAAPVEPAKEPSQPAKTDSKPAASASAAAALDKALEAMLSGETKPAGGAPKEEPAGNETKTDDQPSGKSAGDEIKDEPKSEPVVDDEPRVDFDEPKPAAKAEDEDADEHKGGFPKDWPESAVKNLLKEREKRKEAKRVAEESERKASELAARVKEIEAENSKLKQSPRATAPAASPLAAIDNTEELDAYRKQQQDVLDACDIYADGKPQLDEKGKPVLSDDGTPVLELTKRQVAEIRIKARRALEDEVPQREKFLKDRASFEADTVSRYPWLKNEESKAKQEVERIRKNWQAVSNGPGLTRLIVWALRGRDLEHRENESRKAAPDKKAPAQPTKPSAERPAPSKNTDKEARKLAASTAIRSGKGGSKALEEFLAADFSED